MTSRKSRCLIGSLFVYERVGLISDSDLPAVDLSSCYIQVPDFVLRSTMQTKTAKEAETCWDWLPPEIQQYIEYLAARDVGPYPIKKRMVSMASLEVVHLQDLNRWITDNLEWRRQTRCRKQWWGSSIEH